ncbi:hypothetical protein [Herbidospora mongoliensis]|uniref:hypothetical protein n=1 Tax=Herbidospora mongoliensis TaxID=688067 RepID=UPI000ADE55EA|nr:hypothetical protein [Herbidospora mongoliensis]
MTHLQSERSDENHRDSPPPQNPGLFPLIFQIIGNVANGLAMAGHRRRLRDRRRDRGRHLRSSRADDDHPILGQGAWRGRGERLKPFTFDRIDISGQLRLSLKATLIDGKPENIVTVLPAVWGDAALTK